MFVLFGYDATLRLSRPAYRPTVHCLHVRTILPIQCERGNGANLNPEASKQKEITDPWIHRSYMGSDPSAIPMKEREICLRTYVISHTCEPQKWRGPDVNGYIRRRSQRREARSVDSRLCPDNPAYP